MADSLDRVAGMSFRWCWWLIVVACGGDGGRCGGDGGYGWLIARGSHCLFGSSGPARVTVALDSSYGPSICASMAQRLSA